MELGPEFTELFREEKALRQAEEVNAPGSGKVLCEIIGKLYEQGNWDSLKEAIVFLAKRRRQPKQAITMMIQQAMTYIDASPADSKYLDTLREISEGKIYLEVEFARITKIVAKRLESEGDVMNASSILQEVQVETYGSMEKDEKLEFLLDQLRLLILQDDFIRFHIVSKKVSRKVLDEEQFLQQKITFYQFLAQYYDHEEDYYEMAVAYRTLYHATNDASYLQQLVMSLILVQFSPEAKDMLLQFVGDDALDESIRSAVKILLGAEIGRLDTAIQQFIPEAKWETLQLRFHQHNVRIIHKYYSKISTTRLSDLLQLDPATTEKVLRDMVTYNGLGAKINRPEGYVRFFKEEGSSLDNWGTDVYELLQKMENATHMIHRERLLK